MSKRITNNNFLLVVSIYLLVFLVIPFVFHMLNPHAFSGLFKGTSDFSSLIYVVLLLIVLGSAYMLSSDRLIKNRLPSIILNDKIVLILTFIFFTISIYFYEEFSYGFRHTGPSLSDAGDDIILLSILKTFFKAYLFITFIYYLKSKVILNKWYVYLLVALSFWFSKSASSDIPVVFISLIFCFNKPNLLTQSSKKVARKFKIFNNSITRLILIIFLGFGVVFMGFANKYGFDEAKNVFLSEKDLIMEQTILRVSTHYASNFAAFKAYEENSYTIKEAIPGTINNLYSRVEYLFSGVALKRGRVWSINRANYLNLFNYTDSDKTGASPGVLASIYYTNNLPIGILLISMYLIFIVKVLKVSFEKATLKLNLLGLLIGVFLIMPFFESPLDNINIINTSFIYLYFTIVTLLKFNHDISLKITSI